jgi:hypothetical protein
MILWTDFLALALLGLVLLGFRLVAPLRELPREVARAIRVLEVLMVLLLVAMVLIVRGQ